MLSITHPNQVQDTNYNFFCVLIPSIAEELTITVIYCPCKRAQIELPRVLTLICWLITNYRTNKLKFSFKLTKFQHYMEKETWYCTDIIKIRIKGWLLSINSEEIPRKIVDINKDGTIYEKFRSHGNLYQWKQHHFQVCLCARLFYWYRPPWARTSHLSCAVYLIVFIILPGTHGTDHEGLTDQQWDGRFRWRNKSETYELEQRGTEITRRNTVGIKSYSIRARVKSEIKHSVVWHPILWRSLYCF